jgi:hypothetical protein
MMARFDHERRAAADRIRQHGTEVVTELDPARPLPPPRKRSTKAEMRAESAKLVREFEAKALGVGQSKS